MAAAIGYFTGMFCVPALFILGVLVGIAYLRTKDWKIALRKAMSWSAIGLVLGFMILIFLSQLL